MKTSLVLFSLIISTIANAGFIQNLTGRIPKFDPRDTHVIIANLSPQKQEKTQWCWAAISRMMMSSHTSNLPSQCEIVSKSFELDCCNVNSLSCNRPYYPERALAKFDFPYKISRPKINPDMHWTQRVDTKGWYKSVVEKIKSGIPVGISRYNNAGTMDGSAHIVLAYGTYNKKGKDYLIIFDPLDGTSKFWDESYVTGFLAWINTLTIE